MKIRRKSCGVNLSGCPAELVSEPSAVLVTGMTRQIHSRIVSGGIERLTPPIRRWNSSGMGGFQTLS